MPDNFDCHKACGQRITFDENVRSKIGKLIPLGEKGLPDDCPGRQSKT
ncbi:hypothetical protein BH18THE2_BH18THE2_14390 [soil metagenome]